MSENLTKSQVVMMLDYPELEPQQVFNLAVIFNLPIKGLGVFAIVNSIRTHIAPLDDDDVVEPVPPTADQLLARLSPQPVETSVEKEEQEERIVYGEHVDVQKTMFETIKDMARSLIPDEADEWVSALVMAGMMLLNRKDITAAELRQYLKDDPDGLLERAIQAELEEQEPVVDRKKDPKSKIKAKRMRVDPTELSDDLFLVWEDSGGNLAEFLRLATINIVTDNQPDDESREETPPNDPVERLDWLQQALADRKKKKEN